jgi:uncharacterized membrane protein YphA (DoxX/SURF4 family)
MSRYFIVAVRWLLAVVFLYAGISKAMNVSAFATAIGHYHLVPVAGNMFIAASLPYLEIYTALLLLSGCWLRPAALLSLLMCGLFTAALTAAAVCGLDIDCGCFASTTGAWSSVRVALVRSLALLGFSLYLFFAVADNFQPDEGE